MTLPVEEREGPNGRLFWRENNKAGGYTYFTDIGCGAVAWGNCIVSPEEMKFLLAWDEGREA